MSQHPNARPTPRGREPLCGRVAGGMRVSEAARQAGAGRQTASKRLARARRGEPMSDRPSRPRRPAGLTPPGAEARVLEARRSMLLAPLALAAETGVPARTRAGIVARSGLPRLADVDRVTGEVRRRGPAAPVRHERERPGELPRVDVKKVARIPDGGGWRALGRGDDPSGGALRPRLVVPARRGGRLLPRRLRGAAPRREGGTCSAFADRCLSFFAGLGAPVERVMTDNLPGYRSRDLDAPLESRGVRHLYARPHGPWQNGKVERMNRTLAQEWQCGRAWEGEAGGADALPAYLEHYNWGRPHSACGGLPPMSRIVGVNNLLARNN
ncbi:MAG: integrase core domain-containing protein [Atopobiaceae bacterium]|nr:integrase core domain-containing protein [Atopobiaceae bacterium]